MTKIVRRTRRQVYELWVKALRSGEYEQTTGRLHFDGQFCCLGVLCDLASKDGGPQWEEDAFMGSAYSLPDRVQQFMALPKQARLADMNDRDGKSFADIATYIEKHVMPRACKEPQ